MLEDRLRPRYSSRTKPETRLYRSEYSDRSEGRSPGCPGRSPGSQQTSPQQRKARAIVAKYRKNVRYAQLHRLKSLVPAVKDREEATEVGVQCTLPHVPEMVA